MATITIRQLDEGTVERLKQRAAAKGHSMEREAREILTREVEVDWEAVKARLAARRMSRPVSVDTTDLIRQMRDERAAWLDERHEAARRKP